MENIPRLSSIFLRMRLRPCVALAKQGAQKVDSERVLQL
jgi:hypothetical protein